MRNGLFAAALVLASVPAAMAQTTVTPPARATATPLPPGIVIAPPVAALPAAPPAGTPLRPGISVTVLPGASPAMAPPAEESAPEPDKENSITITSPAFADGRTMPSKYTKAGANISPPLEIGGLPPKTVSYAILMDDPDAESQVSLHWLAANFLPSTASIPEGKLPKEVVVGANSWSHLRYDGPEPTKSMHRYFIRIYALDVVLNLQKGFTREDFITLIGGHLLGTAQIMGSSNGEK